MMNLFLGIIKKIKLIKKLMKKSFEAEKSLDVLIKELIQ